MSYGANSGTNYNKILINIQLSFSKNNNKKTVVGGRGREEK